MTLLGFGDDSLVFLDVEFSYVSIIGASISVFLGIVMTQSGFDKIFNWEGELDFITGKFANTPLANFSTFGLIQVTIFEILYNIIMQVLFRWHLLVNDERIHFHRELAKLCLPAYS